MSNFQAFRVFEENNQFSSRVVERTTEELPDGDVLIRVHYSSLNYKDALSTTGNKGVTKQYPHTPGIDVVGEVVDDRTGTFAPQNPVLVTGFDLGMNTDGGFGEYVRVPANWVMPLPAELTPPESMIFGTAGLTAGLMVQALLEHGVPTNEGEILVTGATGGVGSLAVAILAKLGYQVVAVSGKSDAVDWLKALGAQEVIGRDALGDPNRPLLKERWRGVVDVVGGATLAAAIKSTRYGGTVTCSGLAGSADLPLNVFPFILRGVQLIGIDSVQCPMPKRQQIWQKLSREWKPANLDALSSTITLSDIAARVEAMLAGSVRGRTVVSLI